MSANSNLSGLQHWISGPGQIGLGLFRTGKFYDAHEAWEQGWKDLPPPYRAEVQVWIMTCGVLVHAGRAKWGPAERLLERSIELLAEAKAHRVLHEVPALTELLTLKVLEEALLKCLAAFRTGKANPDLLAPSIELLKQVEPKFAL